MDAPLPRRLSHFRRLARVLRVAGVSAGGFVAAACSLALDFDRVYPAVESRYPESFIKDPAFLATRPAGDAPLTGAALGEGCREFCTYYAGCLSSPSTCLWYWSYVEPVGAGQSEPPPSLVEECATDCVAAASLTPAELNNIAHASDCKALATSVLEADPTFQARCDEPITECEALCEAIPGQQSLADCLPSLARDRCVPTCACQKAGFFVCLDALDPTEAICKRVASCKAEASIPAERTCTDLVAARP